MEAAGLSLSVVALFVECLKAYRLFSTAQCQGADMQMLKTKFQIEEARLTQWGFYWGYRADPAECKLGQSLQEASQNIAATVELTLQQVSSLLKKYDTVSAKYEGGSRSQVYRGMVWALKDKQTLEATINNLNDFNNGLHQLLPRKCEASLAMVVSCALTRDNDRRDLDNIIAAATSIQDVNTARLARFKKAYEMTVLEEEQQLSPSRTSRSNLKLDANRFELSTRYTSSSRTFAKLDKTLQVIVEWKAYAPNMLSGSATARSTIRHRASHLAELLSRHTPRPHGFNVLTCAGYFEDDRQERFGFAYDLPLDVHPCMPYTLNELLTPPNMPALGVRFRMAVSLSKTLNLLHTSGWLHKSIRPNNIAIFQCLQTNVPEFESPYLLGFEYSRPDGYGEETLLEQSVTASTNQLYRHPEVQGSHQRRYTASDDVYSLGLVLLEIALWRPLSSFCSYDESKESTISSNIHKIKTATSTLPQKVGAIYAQAVEMCLDLGETRVQSLDESAAEWNAKRLDKQNQFYWDIIKKLEECRA